MSSLLQHAPRDEQLTAAIAAGDDRAFDELYHRYAQLLAAYGARVLRDRSRGEDVAQTALSRAYEALRRGTEPLRVKPWLYKIALNVALELKAKDGPLAGTDPDDCVGEAHDASGDRADILAAVQVLPERQRMVFFLREVQGLGVSEVAERLGIANQQVEQSLFAASNRLAEELVFGRRVDCALVRSLETSVLTRFERRALKGHVRACPSCRRSAGLSLSTIGFWVRDALGWLGGGGSVTAAKLGALLATATVVGTSPIVAPAIAHSIRHRSTRADAEAAPASRGVTAHHGSAVRELQRFNSPFVPPLVRPLLPHFAVAPVPGYPLADVTAAPAPAPEETPAAQPGVDDTQAPTVDAPDSGSPPAPAAIDTTPVDSTPVDATGAESAPPDATPSDTTATDPAPGPDASADPAPPDAVSSDTTTTDTTPAP